MSLPYRSNYAGLGIPVIESDRILLSSGKGNGPPLNIGRLLIQSVITTLIFLIIISWFTLALNYFTRPTTNGDYLLLQFSVYFSVIALIIIGLLIVVVVNI